MSDGVSEPPPQPILLEEDLGSVPASARWTERHLRRRLGIEVPFVEPGLAVAGFDEALAIRHAAAPARRPTPATAAPRRAEGTARVGVSSELLPRGVGHPLSRPWRIRHDVDRDIPRVWQPFANDG